MFTRKPNEDLRPELPRPEIVKPPLTTNPPLDKMPLDELVTLRAMMDDQIAQRRLLETERLRQEIQTKSKLLGIDPSELLPGGLEKKPAIKYRHGEDTWTGRGRQPLWLQTLLSEGRTLEEFAVQ